MSNPYRTMIARLAAALQQQVFRDPEMDGNDLPRQAQALLAQPEPPERTDEELLRTYGKAKRDHCYEGDADDMRMNPERAYTVAGLRAVIADDRARTLLDQPELPELTDEEIDDWSGECSDLTRANDSVPDCPIWAPLGWAPPHP